MRNRQSAGHARLVINPVAVLCLLLFPLSAQADTLEEQVSAILAEAGPGTRWGMVVATPDGSEIVSIDPEGRFMPASNTKIFTTAAAFWATGGTLDLPDAGGGAYVRLEPAEHGSPEVILKGRGDARLSAAPDCVTDCLAALADAIAAETRVVHDVIGDDTTFPDQRWSPGMSWNNMPTRSGTGISALSIDDNEIAASVAPSGIGAPPAVTLPAYYTVENHALTVPGREENIGYDRMPGSRILIVTGTIGMEAKPAALRLGVDDPADYAAWNLAAMLRERGVRITGSSYARHRVLLPEDDPQHRDGTTAPPAPARPTLASLTPQPLAEDILTINKLSQNLHAELLLRRLGLIHGTGSIADGQAIVRGMLDDAGVAQREASFSDGSGMSSYNRVAPRGTVRLLAWIMKRNWGAAWRASLPVGAVDGTLHSRFAGTWLDSKITAKTGSLNAASALAGYMIAKSGRTLIFAVYANDQPDDVSVNPIMDRALEYVAEHQ